MHERVKEIIAHLRERAAAGATELEAERRKRPAYEKTHSESGYIHTNNIRWRTVNDLERDADALQALLDAVPAVDTRPECNGTVVHEEFTLCPRCDT